MHTKLDSTVGDRTKTVVEADEDAQFVRKDNPMEREQW